MADAVPAYGFDPLAVTGPGPFGSDASASTGSVGATTITVPQGTDPVVLSIPDDDASFEDGDGGQSLAQGAVVNGTSFPAGTDIEIE
jgi:hypothetical protein